MAGLDGADCEVALHSPAAVERARVDGAAHDAARVRGEEPICRQLRLRAGQVQLAEVRHVEHGHLVAARVTLLTDLGTHDDKYQLNTWPNAANIVASICFWDLNIFLV